MGNPMRDRKAVKLCGGARYFGRFGSDNHGTTAIEFGFVALPFFIIVFGVFLYGLKFFTENSLEYAVEAAARDIRTGQAQKAGKTVDDFRQMVCDEASSYISCSGKLVLHVQTGANWSDIVPTSCLTGGSLTAATSVGADALEDYSGASEAVVLVTACYEWDLPQAFTIFQLGNMSNGSSLVKGIATFRTEPYS